jgi:hypothetical protein
LEANIAALESEIATITGAAKEKKKQKALSFKEELALYPKSFTM